MGALLVGVEKEALSYLTHRLKRIRPMDLPTFRILSVRWYLSTKLLRSGR